MSELFKKQLGAASDVGFSRRTATDTLPCALRRWDETSTFASTRRPS